MNNLLSQIPPEILKQLLMQQGQQQMPQDQMSPMGNPNTQQQFDPMMLASLLRGTKLPPAPTDITIGTRG